MLSRVTPLAVAPPLLPAQYAMHGGGCGSSICRSGGGPTHALTWVAGTWSCLIGGRGGGALAPPPRRRPDERLHLVGRHLELLDRRRWRRALAAAARALAAPAGGSALTGAVDCRRLSGRRLLDDLTGVRGELRCCRRRGRCRVQQ